MTLLHLFVLCLETRSPPSFHPANPHSSYFSLPTAPLTAHHHIITQEIMSKNKVYKSFIGLGYYETLTPGVIQRNVRTASTVLTHFVLNFSTYIPFYLPNLTYFHCYLSHALAVLVISNITLTLTCRFFCPHCKLLSSATLKWNSTLI